MNGLKIGVLHPGNMGVSAAASLKEAGNDVCWASEGRSVETRQRADDAKLRDLGSVRQLCDTCAILVSVCPPHAAASVSEQIVAYGFTGLLLDANAISPQTACAIGDRVLAAGGNFVDGGIVGGPAWTPGETVLYLAGPSAESLAPQLRGGPLDVDVVSSEIGKASALKMCYAAYTKGTTALLSSILAVADGYGVRANLESQWSRDDASFVERTHRRVRRVTAKAWRFSAEMEEIAATFRAAGLPGGFHEAAANVYRRIEGLEKATELPPLEAVLARILGS